MTEAVKAFERFLWDLKKSTSKSKVLRTNPTLAARPQRRRNFEKVTCVNGEEAMMAFCGFPTSVMADPMLALVLRV